MNTELYRSSEVIPSVDLSNMERLVPYLHNPRRDIYSKYVDSTGDNLNISISFSNRKGYANYTTPFPYMRKDMFLSKMTDTEIQTVVLENDYLKATFIPSLGGRVHSLVDKTTGRELLYKVNHIRPTATMAGGAWLCGAIQQLTSSTDHSTFACAPMFTATTKLADGTPVLRFYEFERVRGIFFQVDWFIPNDSKVLYSRTAITNARNEDIPAHWFCYCTVPADPKTSRTITSADGYYKSIVDNTTNTSTIIRQPLPLEDGNDITYFYNGWMRSYWAHDKNRKPFMSSINQDGTGCCTFTTDNLLGEKIASFPTSWQPHITYIGGRDDFYVELKQGLGRYIGDELTLPAKTTWEWIRGFAACDIDPNLAHGEWPTAQDTVEGYINNLISNDDFNKLFNDTSYLSTQVADEVILEGEHWGELEHLRQEADNETITSTHLDFGKLDEKQTPWLNLLNTGSFGDQDPNVFLKSYMLQPEWNRRVEAAINDVDKDSWYAWLHWGLINYHLGDNLVAAENAFETSLSKQRNLIALFLLLHYRCNYGPDYTISQDEYDFIMSYIDKDISFANFILFDSYRALPVPAFNFSSQDYVNIIESLPKEYLTHGTVRDLYVDKLIDVGRVDDAVTFYNSTDLILGPYDVGFDHELLWCKLEIARRKLHNEVITVESIVPPTEIQFMSIEGLQDWLKNAIG